MGWVGWIGVVVMAYLMGSIPFAYLAGRVFKGKDIREEGDRNPGAANAYRSIGPKVGLAVGAADIGKGAVAVLVAKGLTANTGAEMLAGAVVVAGHNWPVFSQFRGGRGAASTVGVLIALIPMPAIPVSLVAVVTLPFSKSATRTLGLIMIPMPLLAWLTGASYGLVVYSVGLPMGVGIRHYLTSRNLSRLEDDQVGAEQAEGQALPHG